MLTVEVILREAAMTFDRIYTYEVPEDLAADIAAGRRVLVPFGSGDRTREAFCWSEPKVSALDASSADKTDKTKYKEIHAVLDSAPLLREDLIDLAKQMKMRYACTYGEAVRTMLPAGTQIDISDWIRLPDPVEGTADQGERYGGLPIALVESLTAEKELSLTSLQEEGYSRSKVLQWVRDGLLVRGERLHQNLRVRKQRYVSLNAESGMTAEEAFDSGLVNSVQQESVLAVLKHDGPRPENELLDELRIGPSALKTLQRKGLIVRYEVEDAPQVEASLIKERDEFLNPDMQPEEDVPVLTSDQAAALSAVRSSETAAGKLSEFLLFGVTGSGKTEIYMRLAADCIDEGKQAIILVPEIALTPQTTARFAARFGDRLAVLHSRLTTRQRFEEWRRIREGHADLIIGARSAIFAPVECLGLVVIDEEHEQTYQQESSPRYSALTVARLRALHHGARLIFGSATPSAVSYRRTELGRSVLLELTERPGSIAMPEVQIVDLKKDRGSGSASGIISEQLRESLSRSFSRGEQAMLFLNRRGYASVYLCTDCGEQVMCPHCEVKLTWHRGRARLICHYCGYMTKTPESCPSCRGDQMSWQGFGTEQVERCCHEMFPEARILRMDQDTTSGRNAHWKILQQFRDRAADLLIGTQMIAKGHDFPFVTTVGILSADQMLAINDYRAGERAFQLMTQASGRAGRADKPGQVLLQAFNIDDYAVRAAAENNYEAFYREESRFRKYLNYPPYGVLGTVQLSGSREIETRKWADKMVTHLLEQQEKQKQLQGVLITQPLPAPMYKLGNRYRMQINLRSETEAPVAAVLHAVRTLSLPRGMTAAYGMDPA